MHVNRKAAAAPMALHYRTDGSGRDLYIYTNNGGFSATTFAKPGDTTGDR